MMIPIMFIAGSVPGVLATIKSGAVFINDFT